MGAEKTLVNVNKGQDAYSVIGNYILNHVTAIEDMIAVIQINGVIIKELYMVDVNADGYFYWKSDWWEGEEDVSLLDFFSVSDAERMKMGKWIPHKEISREYIGTVLMYVTYDYWFCDNCNYRVENGQPMYNFCPNCGADMREEDKSDGNDD